MPTVAPIRKLTEEERPNTNWYARLVDWWGFDTMDIAPMMGVTRGVKKLPKALKKSAVVTKKEQEFLQRAPLPVERAKAKTKNQRLKTFEKALKSGVVGKQLREKGYYEP